jgi:hypothetical protein
VPIAVLVAVTASTGKATAGLVTAGGVATTGSALTEDAVAVGGLNNKV